MSKSSDYLRDVMLVDPEKMERARIYHVEGAEKGHDHLRIYTQSLTQREAGTMMLHKIYSEEVESIKPPRIKSKGGMV